MKASETLSKPKPSAAAKPRKPKEKTKTLNITNYKITPLQLAEIETHLELASYILNNENLPNWEDLNTACGQIADAQEDLKIIREKSRNEISVF